MIGILAALPSETRHILARMTDIQETPVAATPFYRGRIGVTPVTLVECSVGKVNAAAYAQILIDRFGAEKLLNTGIAGSLDDRAKHLSIVVAESVAYHDVDWAQMEAFRPHRRAFDADPALVARFMAAAGDRPDILRGGVVTGDAFIRSGAKKRELRDAFGALCVEMEGAAVGHVAALNGVGFLVIRCISDMADDTAQEVFDEYEEEAARKVSAFVVEAIGQGA